MRATSARYIRHRICEIEYLANRSPSASKNPPTPLARTEKATESGTESNPGQPPTAPPAPASNPPPSPGSGSGFVSGALWLGTISYRFSLSAEGYTNEIDLKV